MAGQVERVPPLGALGGSPAGSALTASALSGSVGKSKMPKALAGEFFVPFKCIWLTLMTYKCVYLLLGRIISSVGESVLDINYKSQTGTPGEIPSRNLLVCLCLIPNIKHEQSWWKRIGIQTKMRPGGWHVPTGLGHEGRKSTTPPFCKM